MNNLNNVFNVVNGNLHQFQVRIIDTGEQYDTTLFNDGDPMVEFLDTTLNEAGQSISMFYVSSLIDHEPGSSLDLAGGISKWIIDGDTMDSIVDWLNDYFGYGR
ncbi:MAG: hypothetical protein DRN27_10020 [Thermoplasmata archaeon]|nr:MAG: hypothetical protein DRN27_10020 [Thermoplasmata archaeon]